MLLAPSRVEWSASAATLREPVAQPTIPLAAATMMFRTRMIARTFLMSRTRLSLMGSGLMYTRSVPLPSRGRACVNCGDPVTGSGDLCADCTPSQPTAPPGSAACPHCEVPNPWERMRRYRRTHENGQVEVLYYCPNCRGVLEAACWMER